MSPNLLTSSSRTIASYNFTLSFERMLYYLLLSRQMVSLCVYVYLYHFLVQLILQKPYPFFFFFSFFLLSKCSEKVALHALKASDWHLEGAFDVFYSQPQIKAFTDSRHLEELYSRYKGKFFFSHCVPKWLPPPQMCAWHMLHTYFPFFVISKTVDYVFAYHQDCNFIVLVNV